MLFFNWHNVDDIYLTYLFIFFIIICLWFIELYLGHTVKFNSLVSDNGKKNENNKYIYILIRKKKTPYLQIYIDKKIDPYQL